MISSYLLAFNTKQENDYTSSDKLIEYLDEEHPDWRTIITSLDEFMEFFKTKVHVLQNDSWLGKLANEIFDIVGDSNYIESVWNDTTLDDCYRYAAIKRLISIDSTQYLPLYTAELLAGGFNLHGWGSVIISELYDFQDSVKIVLDSKNWTGRNFEYLAQQACEYWQEYPQELRKDILCNRDYYIRKNCNDEMWKIMTMDEKLYLANVIVANEYAMFHDIVTYTNFLKDRDESKAVYLTNEFGYILHNVVEHNDKHYIKHILSQFDAPTYDMVQCTYTPSEQISRFQTLAQKDSNDMVYRLIHNAIQTIEHSTH